MLNNKLTSLSDR